MSVKQQADVQLLLQLLGVLLLDEGTAVVSSFAGYA